MNLCKAFLLQICVVRKFWTQGHNAWHSAALCEPTWKLFVTKTHCSSEEAHILCVCIFITIWGFSCKHSCETCMWLYLYWFFAHKDGTHVHVLLALSLDLHCFQYARYILLIVLAAYTSTGLNIYSAKCDLWFICLVSWKRFRLQMWPQERQKCVPKADAFCHDVQMTRSQLWALRHGDIYRVGHFDTAPLPLVCPRDHENLFSTKMHWLSKRLLHNAQSQTFFLHLFWIVDQLTPFEGCLRIEWERHLQRWQGSWIEFVCGCGQLQLKAVF